MPGLLRDLTLIRLQKTDVWKTSGKSGGILLFRHLFYLGLGLNALIFMS
jgi:hypothetical protein